MRAVFLAMALCVAFAAPANAQARPDRLALVIGNADYNGNGRLETNEVGVATSREDGFAPDLRNPLNDAVMIRDTLMAMGYEVTYRTNLDRAAMTEAFGAFNRNIAAASTDAKVVIYYAGHAFQIGRTLYLLPTKAQLPASVSQSNLQALSRVAMPTTDVTLHLRAATGTGINLFVIDGCRIDPWSMEMHWGIDAIQYALGELPGRTLMSYASTPGRTAQDGALNNSPFALALRTNMPRRDFSVDRMLEETRRATRRATRNQQSPMLIGGRFHDTCIAECAPMPSRRN